MRDGELIEHPKREEETLGIPAVNTSGVQRACIDQFGDCNHPINLDEIFLSRSRTFNG